MANYNHTEHTMGSYTANTPNNVVSDSYSAQEPTLGSASFEPILIELRL